MPGIDLKMTAEDAVRLLGNETKTSIDRIRRIGESLAEELSAAFKARADLPPLPSIATAAAAGVIDPVSNLRRTKVYTYCGTKDWHLGGSIANARFFAEFGLPENQLSNFSIPSGHAWPEDSGIKQCGDEAGFCPTARGPCHLLAKRRCQHTGADKRHL